MLAYKCIFAFNSLNCTICTSVVCISVCVCVVCVCVCVCVLVCVHAHMYDYLIKGFNNRSCQYA